MVLGLNYIFFSDSLAARVMVAHPFFDRRTFPYARPDADDLFKRLRETIKTHAEINLILEQCGSQEDIAAGSTLTMWKSALDLLCKHNVLRKLGENLTAAHHARALAAFKVIEAESDTFSCYVLPAGELFINRANLRHHLSKLNKIGQHGVAQPIGGLSGVLIIRGESRSGKSHTRHLIAQHATAMGEIVIIIDENSGGTVKDVQNLIFSNLKSDPTAAFSTEYANYHLACEALLTQASVSQKRCWIIADDMGIDSQGNVKCDQEIVKFFEQMALFSMSRPNFASYFRLILIDYTNEKDPSKWNKPQLLVDNTKLSDFSKEAVSEVMRWEASKRGQELSETESIEQAQTLIGSMQPNEGIEHLSAKLADVLNAM